MTHEVGTIAHEIGDVVGITEKVLPFGRRASPITSPVRYQQAKPFFGERSLCLPLVSSYRQGTVHQHHGHTGTPRVYEEVSHRRGPRLGEAQQYPTPGAAIGSTNAE